MIKGLLIYAGFVGLAVAGLSIGAHVPLDVALGMFAIGALGVLSIAVPVLILRTLPKRKPRQAWTHLTCDPVAPSLTTRATAEIVAPQHKQLEAPRREMEVSR